MKTPSHTMLRSSNAVCSTRTIFYDLFFQLAWNKFGLNSSVMLMSAALHAHSFDNLTLRELVCANCFGNLIVRRTLQSLQRLRVPKVQKQQGKEQRPSKRSARLCLSSNTCEIWMKMEFRNCAVICIMFCAGVLLFAPPTVSFQT